MASFKEHPQPRTFAPSKEDVLQSERHAQAAHALLACSRPPRCVCVCTDLQYFFGAPISPEKLKDVSGVPSNLDAHHHPLPTN